MMENPFLRTKFYIPPYRAEWVSRPDLVARLDAGLSRKLILLSAPAGFGKTTLLCEWIQHIKILEGSKARTQFAWLSLDENDNDASRFLAYLTKALESIHPGGDEVDLADLRLAQPPIQTILNKLINTVDEWQRGAPEGSRVVLILDDYHAITAEPVHHSLIYLLDLLPPRMHLVIATRADPPLSLARLRLAQGQFAAALQLLDSLLPEVIKVSRLGLRIEIQVLRALTLYSLGKQVDAFSALEAALSLAEPAGYIRIFLDEGNPMYRLLSEAQPRNPPSAYVAGLLAASEREREPEVSPKAGCGSQMPLPGEIEPLSERELEVLFLLRSRLTVPEMAETLVVAESTVRSHIKSIYSKLAVHRRMDAVQRAEELGLAGRKPSRRPS